MKIGILSHNYAAQRLFLNKIDNTQYKDLRLNNSFLYKNAYLWLLKYMGKLHLSPEEMVARLFYNYRSILPNDCDLYHFFNCVSFDKKQWVLSVESAVPWPVAVTRCTENKDGDFSAIRKNTYVDKRLKALAKSNCLAILPLSKCSYNIQIELLKEFPQYAEAIQKKMFTLHPAQTLQIKNIEEKGLTWDDSELFTFIYVGNNYYRKGGRETVQVLAELHRKYDFRLILISAMAIDELRYMRTSHDEEDARKLIEDNKDWIEFHAGLPNTRVLEKMKKAHICLLPTWMDTYAYSVLESQACGTPCITTDLRALTEINSDEVGWRVGVPVNRLNNPLHTTRLQQDEFYETLLAGLREKVEYVLTHREEVREKSTSCLKYIQKSHNPIEYADKLRRIYNGEVGILKAEC